MERSFGRDLKDRGPVSQQMWHDKDSSLLKGHENTPNIGLSFAARPLSTIVKFPCLRETLYSMQPMDPLERGVAPHLDKLNPLHQRKLCPRLG